MRPQGQALHSILSVGVLAPSADKRHRLRFALVDGVVHLLGTDASTWPGQPHRQMLALGAVIENMALRSARLGLAMQATLWPASQRLDHVADLHWDESILPADPLALAIESRHTNRRLYQRSALPTSAISALSAAAAPSPGAQVRWLDAGRALCGPACALHRRNGAVQAQGPAPGTVRGRALRGRLARLGR